MEATRALLFIVIVVGGVVVLGSYAHGLATHADPGAAMWGGVPRWLRPVYTASMLAAAVGYLAAAWFQCFALPRAGGTIGPFGYSLFPLLQLLILGPSALWMGLTFRYLATPTPMSWLGVRAVLLVVGGASVALTLALAKTSPRVSIGGQRIAVAGAAVFAFHTMLLDGLLWPILFRAK